MAYFFCKLRFCVAGISLLCALTACGSSDSNAVSSTTVPVSDSGQPAVPSTPSSTPGATGSATVSWAAPTANEDGTKLTNLAGFHVYYGTDATQLSTRLDITSPSVTSARVENLKLGTYYFSASAYTTDGVEGDKSQVVTKIVS